MAAASRLFRLNSSFLRLHPKPSHPSISRPILRLRVSGVSRPRFYAVASEVAADDVAAPSVEEGGTVSQWWPEWEHFVGKLKSKGYFEKASPTIAAEEPSGGSSELNRVKTACLTFARERFDILRALPRKDIEAVVGHGCPNLFRKSVNSAKRLRAFLRLDEGDVCSACNLRSSCDKAYIISKEDEAARTVDVMRILLSYAVDANVLSGDDKPSIKDNVEESARKLLSELVKLSDTTIDPTLPKPAFPSLNGKEVKELSQTGAQKNKRTQNVEMKRGDWLCPSCNFLNFARNVRCLQCKEEGPEKVDFGKVEMKLGDWICVSCDYMNFARNKKCFRCQEPRPSRVLAPGEWECPSCDFFNYKRNKVCFKCSCDRPMDAANQFEDHLWRRPKVSEHNNNLSFGDDEGKESDDDDDIFSASRR